MISELIKRVMHECKLDQKQLAEVMGVKLQRIKNLSSGYVKKLTREEGEALIRKLKIRGDWLATGEGPMFQTAGEQELHSRLDAVRTTTDRILELGLPIDQTQRLRDVLYALETGNTTLLSILLQAPPEPRARALLDNYENADDAGKKIIEGTATLAAQSAVRKKAS